MSGKRQCHVAAAPVAGAAVPLFGTGPVSLRREAVVEEGSRVAFESAEIRPVRENDRCADEVSGPFLAVFLLAGIEQHEILASFRQRVIPVRGVEVSEMAWWIGEWRVTYAPLHLGEAGSPARQLQARRTKKRPSGEA